MQQVTLIGKNHIAYDENTAQCYSIRVMVINELTAIYLARCYISGPEPEIYSWLVYAGCVAALLTILITVIMAVGLYRGKNLMLLILYA